LGELALCHGECGARVADVNCNKIHLSPHLFESGDEWGVFDGLLLKPRMTSEVSAESDLNEDEVSLLAVEGGRVRRGGARDSSGVDKVGGRSMSWQKCPISCGM
jgi:hypothetical protein